MGVLMVGCRLLFLLLIIFFTSDAEAILRPEARVKRVNWANQPTCHGAYDFEGDADDSSVYGRNGTVNGATQVSGQVGNNAYSFDGSNDYISVSFPLFDSIDSITLMAWVYVDSDTGSNESLFGLTTSDDKPNYEFRVNTNLDEIELVWRNSGDTDWVSFITDGDQALYAQWFHVALTHTFGSTSDDAIYINGEPVSITGSGTDAPYTGGTQVGNIGRRENAGLYFNGDLDEVAVFKRILSKYEINRIKDEGLSVD